MLKSNVSGLMQSASIPVPLCLNPKRGGPVSNTALSFMDIMTAKTAKDFALDVKQKSN